MKANLLLLETQCGVLKRLQLTSLQQNFHVQTLYMQDPQMAIEAIKLRHIGVVIANFDSNLKGFHDFCLKVREQAPFFVMFILLIDEQSGEVTNEIKFAHQILPASCAEKEIVAAIGRGITLSLEVRKNPKLASFLVKLDSLPSPPFVYFDLRDQLGLPNCNAGILTEIISRDQALAAKILRVANSGFYAVPRTIANLHQAITLLGTETLLGLVLATHLFEGLPLPGLNLDNLWKHAVAVALMSRQAAKERGAEREQVEASGIAGLLHDLGSLVFISNKPAEYQTLLRNANGDEMRLIAMERQNYGVDHAELGGLVLLLWGLPDAVVHAVRHHHDYAMQDTLVAASPTWAVLIAEFMFNHTAPMDAENKEDFLKNCPLRCTPEQFDLWQNIFEQLQIQATI